MVSLQQAGVIISDSALGIEITGSQHVFNSVKIVVSIRESPQNCFFTVKEVVESRISTATTEDKILCKTFIFTRQK